MQRQGADPQTREEHANNTSKSQTESQAAVYRFRTHLVPCMREHLAASRPSALLVPGRPRRWPSAFRLSAALHLSA
jgi:hypothetical protein